MEDKAALIAQIVASYAARPDATVDSIVALASRLTSELAQPPAESSPASEGPATPLRGARSLTPESAVTREKIYCLCCGKGFKMLKRHLGAEHDLTEEAYRLSFGLSDDYPLVAPGYSERKASYARSVGFGKYDRNTVDAN